MSLPALIIVAFLMVWAIIIGTVNVRAAAAANDLARGLARGEVADLLVVQMRQSLPAAQVSVEQHDGLAHVAVRQFVSPGFGVFKDLGFTIEQRASAPLEFTS